MLENRSMTHRYAGLFLLGCFLFSYPILTLFNRENNVFGVPLFFFYIFTAWTVLIVFIIVCGRMPEPDTDENRQGLSDKR